MDLHFNGAIWPFLAAAFLAALAGGWHCAGMCGAIATLATNPRATFLYQVGRLSAYLGLGLLVATAGRWGQGLVDDPHRWMVTLLMAVLAFWILTSTWRLPIFMRAQRWIWRHRPRGSKDVEAASLGLLNGLLPCHWLYGYLFLAAGLESPLRGTALMFCLWLGSLPWLLGFSLFGRHVRVLSGHATWVARVLMAFVFLGLIAHQLHSL